MIPAGFDLEQRNTSTLVGHYRSFLGGQAVVAAQKPLRKRERDRMAQHDT